MYPYRRTNKKKGKPNNRRSRDGQRKGASAPHDLLSTMPPATKALAQLLAGNSKSSGQLVNARNILSQAQRLVDDKQVDRMPPAQREEFLEQFARLKLTVTDAESGLDDDAFDEEVEVQETESKAAAIAPERLRELALSFTTSSTTSYRPGEPRSADRGSVDANPETEAPDDGPGAGFVPPDPTGAAVFSSNGRAEAVPPKRGLLRLKHRSSSEQAN